MSTKHGNAIETVNQWLARLNPEDPNLMLNEHGQCLLTSQGEDCCIVFVPNAQSQVFHLFHDVAKMPESVDARIYETMLSLNLPVGDFNAGSLGFDPQMRTMVLSMTWEIAQTDITSFFLALARFIEATGHMRKTLASLLPPNTGSTGGKPSFAMSASARVVRTTRR